MAAVVQYRQFEIEVGSPTYERLKTVAELRARADEAGIEVPKKATKAQIKQLLEEQMQANASETLDD